MLSKWPDLRQLVVSEHGQDMVEYVLLIMLIALLVAIAIPGFSGALVAAFQQIATTLVAFLGG